MRFDQKIARWFILTVYVNFKGQGHRWMFKVTGEKCC